MCHIDDMAKLVKGKNVMVIACGPSMRKWSEVYSAYSEDEKPFVLCIKQSIRTVGLLCDMHVLNAFNLVRYKYSKRKNIFVVLGRPIDSSVVVYGEYDYTYSVKKNQGLLESTTAAQKTIEGFDSNMKFTDQPNWGPGIMYEFVIPFLVYAEVSKITTVGWDIADNEGQNGHYFDSSRMSFKSRICSLVKKLLPILNWGKSRVQFLSISLRCKHLVCFIRYMLGLKINSAGMRSGEAILVSSSLPLLRKWLKAKGIEITIISDSIWMDNDGTPSKE